MPKLYTRPVIAAAMTAAFFSAASLPIAAAQPALPPVQQQGRVEYITGGIGLDESEAIKAAMKDYSLVLIFAARHEGKAEYVADVPVSIVDKQGNTLLDLKTEGPYLLVKLAPGEYRITAQRGHTPQTRSVTVKKETTARTVFEWR